MAKQVELFNTAGLATDAWTQLLEKQMAAVQQPWLDPHVASLSFEGFAVVSRLGQAVRYAEPFDEAARHQIDEDLGDPIEIEDDAGPDERNVAHLEADMNGAILSISPTGVGDVLIQTGFVFKSRFAPLPPTTDGSDPGYIFHPVTICSLQPLNRSSEQQSTPECTPNTARPGRTRRSIRTCYRSGSTAVRKLSLPGKALWNLFSIQIHGAQGYCDKPPELA